MHTFSLKGNEMFRNDETRKYQALVYLTCNGNIRLNQSLIALPLESSFKFSFIRIFNQYTLQAFLFSKIPLWKVEYLELFFKSEFWLQLKEDSILYKIVLKILIFIYN
jgi:hypothetical protein